MKPTISFDEFAKLDLRIATITAVEPIEGADKLWKIMLDVGDVEQGGLGERVIAAGVKPWYTAEQLIGKQIIYLANLEPRTLRGIESQGMLIAAGGTEAILLHPDKATPNGAQLR